MSLLSLPTELLIKSLIHLDVEDAYAVQKAHQRIHDIYQHSVELQYDLRCKITGVDDNPSCTLPISTRLKMLIEHEKRWLSLEPTYSTRMKPPRVRSNCTVLSDEYILTEMISAEPFCERNGVQSCRIPSLEDTGIDDENRWTLFVVQGFVGFTHSIEENDLLVCFSKHVVTYLQDTVEYHVHFFQHSTGGLHPLAVTGGIHLASEGPPRMRPNAIAQVSGDNLVMIIPTSSALLLHVYDWKIGTPKSAPIAVDAKSFVFLQSDLFLSPNVKDSCLDIYSISSSDPSVKRICRLGLPRLASDTVLCCSSPQPTKNNVFPKYISSARPFRERPEDAIILFRFVYFSATGNPQQLLGMVSHRKSIINTIRTLEPTRSSVKFWRSIPWQNWGAEICRWSTKFVRPMCYAQHLAETPWEEHYPRASAIPKLLSFNPHYIRYVNTVYGDEPYAVGTRLQLTQHPTPPIFAYEVINKLQSVEIPAPIFKGSDVLHNGVAIVTYREHKTDEELSLLYLG